MKSGPLVPFSASERLDPITTLYWVRSMSGGTAQSSGSSCAPPPAPKRARRHQAHDHENGTFHAGSPFIGADRARRLFRTASSDKQSDCDSRVLLE
jgi:hypothetical protein